MGDIQQLEPRSPVVLTVRKTINNLSKSASTSKIRSFSQMPCISYGSRLHLPNSTTHIGGRGCRLTSGGKPIHHSSAVYTALVFTVVLVSGVGDIVIDCNLSNGILYWRWKVARVTGLQETYWPIYISCLVTRAFYHCTSNTNAMADNQQQCHQHQHFFSTLL